MESDPRAARTAIGLIAGGGSLPLVLAKAVKARGHALVCLALEGADPTLTSMADHAYHIRFGEMEDGIAALRRHGATGVLMAGRVSRTDLLERGDALFRRVLAEAPDHRDQTVFRHAVGRMRDLGIHVLNPLEFAPDLVVAPGVHTRRVPSDEEWADIRLGMVVARATAALDVGQTVVLKRGVILAVEAAEGTDAAIRRGAAMAEGAVVVKAARPAQDPRFDLPAIGVQTIVLLRDARATALAVEAGKTLLLERADALAGADHAGIAVVGVDVGESGVRGQGSPVS